MNSPSKPQMKYKKTVKIELKDQTIFVTVQGFNEKVEFLVVEMR